jgi:hypothetical protein
LLLKIFFSERSFPKKLFTFGGEHCSEQQGSIEKASFAKSTAVGNEGDEKFADGHKTLNILNGATRMSEK